MRIWYVNHYAIPDHFGIGGRPQYVGRALMAHGHDVTILGASDHHYLHRLGENTQTETFRSSYGGYLFRTIPTPSYRGNGLGRFGNMLAFGKGVAKALLAEKRAGSEPDIIIVSSPHPLAWKPIFAGKSPGVGLIFEERDIWPESLMEIKGLPSWHPLIVWLAYRIRCIYRQADAVVSLLPLNEQRLLAKGMRKGGFCHIPNGVDRESRMKREKDELPLEISRAFDQARSRGKLIILYAGSMGPPNALESLLALAAVDGGAGGRPYHIFLMGDGVSRAALENKARDLDFITFLPAVKREVSFVAMRRADVLYLSIAPHPNLYKYGISMNKLFDYMMAERPILQVLQGGNHPVSDSGAGVELPTSDPIALDAAMRRFAELTLEERLEMGRCGREYVLANHDWEELGCRYNNLCIEVAEMKKGGGKMPQR